MGYYMFVKINNIIDIDIYIIIEEGFLVLFFD